MGAPNRYRGVDPRVIQLVHRKAVQLVGRLGISRGDEQDIVQELLLDLQQRLRYYDPARASRATFTNRVVNNRVATLLEEREAAKRHHSKCACSFDDDNPNGSGRSREETLRQIGALPDPDPDALDRAVDVKWAIADLPSDLRQVADLLKSMTVSEVARQLEISRSTVHDRKGAIRRRWEDDGLRDYL